jgi:hypothetical protein
LIFVGEYPTKNSDRDVAAVEQAIGTMPELAKSVKKGLTVQLVMVLRQMEKKTLDGYYRKCMSTLKKRTFTSRRRSFPVLSPI